MLARVVVENGVKKLVPLTADTGAGNPVGTVIAVYSNQVPNGYLPCNGVAFDTAQFPVLYALLGDDHTPDLRECTLKGIGESGRTVGAHVKAGGLAVGEFVDDRVQDFRLRTTEGAGGDGDRLSMGTNAGTQATPRIYTLSTNMRNGDTTEVKAVGVNWCIKATSGLTENAQDNVLNILQPVDTVALNNMHSVSSNAVAKALSYSSTQEVFIGYYDGEPLYRKLVTVSGSSLPAVGNTVVIDLPSEYLNRAVIFIHANMVRDNFGNNIPLGKYFNIFLENRTKLDIEQSATSNQEQYTALIWLDYVYLS